MPPSWKTLIAHIRLEQGNILQNAHQTNIAIFKCGNETESWIQVIQIPLPQIS